MSIEAKKAVLFDLDGVIRFYAKDDTNAVEDAFGLPHGRIEDVAFRPDLLKLVTTGRISRREWVAQVGVIIGSAEAAEAWEDRPVRVDRDVLSTVQGVKSGGILACLVTNGTDNLSMELSQLGLSTVFDRIFNSADVGVRKPDEALYLHVLSELGLAPAQVAYVDDRIENVTAARAKGIVSLCYADSGSLRAWLLELGIRLQVSQDTRGASGRRGTGQIGESDA